MKRELIENVRVTPYTSGTAFDREGFLSGVLGVLIGTPSGGPETMQAKVVLTECDTEGGTFTVCKDKLIPVGKGMLDDDGAVAVEVDAAGGSLVNFDLDLLGCKKYVKATVSVVCTGGSSPSCTATAALALGDADEVPV